MTRRGDTTRLAVASIGNGALAYVVFAMSTRALGAEDAAPVSVLWTLWGLASAAITFPIQHWIAREVAADGGFAGIRARLPALAGLVLAVVLTAGAGAWVLRDSLFGPDAAGFAGLVAAVVLGSALTGLLRGGLAARRRFGDLAASLLAENGLRCVVVLLLVLGDVEEPIAYGSAIVAGHLAVLFWTSALTFPSTGERGPTSIRLLLGAGGGQLLAQLVLTGGPLLVAVLGGAPREVTAIFVAMAVYRAPHLVALGVVSELTGRLTTLAKQGGTAALLRFRGVVIGGGVLAAGAGAPAGLWLGPPLLQLVFGEDVVVDRVASAALAAGSVLAVVNLVLSVLAIAQARAAAPTRAWLVGLVLASPVLLLGLDVDVRIACWFLAVETVALVVLSRAARPPSTVPAGAGS